MELTDLLFSAVELIGTVSFAVSGAMIAIQRRLDLCIRYNAKAIAARAHRSQIDRAGFRGQFIRRNEQVIVGDHAAFVRIDLHVVFRIIRKTDDGYVFVPHHENARIVYSSSGSFYQRIRYLTVFIDPCDLAVILQNRHICFTDHGNPSRDSRP